jgi:threonine/homoserine/homoserine lactone efflux protein
MNASVLAPFPGVLLSALVGVLLGLSLAAPPGPMNAVIAGETVDRGFRAGVAAGAGAMTADAVFFLLALGGATAVVREAPALRRAMVGAGGLLMLYFAYGAAAGAGEAFTASGPDPEAATAGAGFLKAFALALTNPYQITWWLTAGTGLLRPGEVAFLEAIGPVGGLPTVAGFFGGILLWILGFPAALAAAGARVDRLARLVAYASALALVWFGGAFLWTALRGSP